MLECNGAGSGGGNVPANHLSSPMLTMLNIHDRPFQSLSALHTMADIKHYHHRHASSPAPGDSQPSGSAFSRTVAHGLNNHLQNIGHPQPSPPLSATSAQSPILTTKCTASTASSSSSNMSSFPGTPHSIQDILSRPTPGFGVATSTAASHGGSFGGLPRLSLGAAATFAQNAYFSQASNAGGLQRLAAGLAGDISRQQFYWPSMAHHQAIWRERNAAQGM